MERRRWTTIAVIAVMSAVLFVAWCSRRRNLTTTNFTGALRSMPNWRRRNHVSSFTPYPHQAAGINWIIERPACALFWGMGTGKTVTTLTAIDQLLFNYLEDGPVLVIAPKRVHIMMGVAVFLQCGKVVK